MVCRGGQARARCGLSLTVAWLQGRVTCGQATPPGLRGDWPEGTCPSPMRSRVSLVTGLCPLRSGDKFLLFLNARIPPSVVRYCGSSNKRPCCLRGDTKTVGLEE